MRLMRRISQALKQRSAVRDTESMIEGDHWLDGRGWVGPKFKEGSDGAQDALVEIKRQFVSKNTLNEVCKRHRDSVTGQEPQWSFNVKRPLQDDEKPTAEEDVLIREAEQLLTNWFDRQEVKREWQDAVKTLLWAKIDGQRSVSPLRLYLPDTEVEPDGTLPTDLPTEELIRKISLKRISPQQCGVVMDSHGNSLAGFYQYKDESQDVIGSDSTRLELNVLWRHLLRLDEELAKELVSKLGYEPDDKDTVVAIYKATGDEQAELLDATSYALGERLLIYEMAREPLVAESAISLQKQQNLALTLMSHNVVQGGFLERTILNGQRPGHWVNREGKRIDAAEAGDDATFMPEPMSVGAGSTNFIMGEPIYDPETGEITGYTVPSMLYRDPVPVTTFKDTATEARHGIYEETNQIHVIISGDATSSGTSRIQAANDFVGSLSLTAGEVEVSYRWMLETVLTWFGLLSSQEGRWDGLRAVVKPRLTAVQPTSEELRLVIEQYNAGLLSQATAMSRSGIEDTDAEIDAIEEDRERAMASRVTVPGEMDEADEADDQGAEGEGEDEPGQEQ